MNVLILGNGKGSWIMRGQQLGAAIGARVANLPNDADLKWADLVVLVKKAGALFAPQVHQAGKPIVWDALDFWRQPDDHRLTEPQAIAKLHAQIAVIKPVLTIGATEAMAQACDGVYLPHHSWAGLVPTPARETVQTVAYQGNAAYLGRWLGVVSQACAARGWRFVVNPEDLSTADLLVAFRDGPWDGWICREWKSGVKLVNANAAGRPIITQDSAASREIAVSASRIAGPDALPVALDFWASKGQRAFVADMAHVDAPAYTLEAIAARYQLILASVQVPA